MQLRTLLLHRSSLRQLFLMLDGGARACGQRLPLWIAIVALACHLHLCWWPYINDTALTPLASAAERDTSPSSSDNGLAPESEY